MRRCLLSMFALALLCVGLVPCVNARAQEIKSAPGQFDYYVLNLSWAPDFCNNLKTLTDAERAEGVAECDAPRGFVLHGLWLQNNDGTYPGYCERRPGPVHPERNLDLTPNLSLLKHEWAKHGTCTTLSPEGFFATARQGYTSVVIPDAFKRLDHEIAMRPDDILGMFYRANPAFPQQSFALSCGRNELTAIEACFDKNMKPQACVNLRSCRANSVKVVPEASGQVVR